MRARWSKKISLAHCCTIKSGILFGVVALCVLAGIFLPGIILNTQADSGMAIAQTVSEQYDLVFHSAEEQGGYVSLTASEQLQLVTGKWESERQQANAEEMALSGYEAANAAREGVQELYESKVYPDSIATAYGNWYTWTAAPFKAVDAAFGTYAAYYWEVTFEKYDGSQTHTVYLLEDGTVFLAEARYADGYGRSVRDASKLSIPNATLMEFGPQTADALSFVPYYDGSVDDYQWQALTWAIVMGGGSYYIVQAFDDAGYLFAVAM